ncbi:Uma2 family endonuclease (plasmid) [Skermanella rosea]|uniref:Uma2 family endonuclease n=1 Tax=Skermanella rosea TaxID=1817965 RepID=UPI001931DE88|nr:Uma2 family endonuclease [Skermanella rosea]UEM07695.1 Uma2 family endonuclease [Skermanella rosea]
MTGHPAERRFSTIEEFIAWEERQPERFEFLDGRVWPHDADPAGMAGGTIRHNDIVFNIRTALAPIFRPCGCRVQSETVKLKTHTFSAYPDVLVTCAPVTPDASRVAEAILLVEVVSEGTEHKDRGPKQQNYLDTAFCLYYVLVSQDAQMVEVYSRAPAGWIYRSYRDPDDRIELLNADAKLAMADIYRDTDVPPYRTVVPMGR